MRLPFFVPIFHKIKQVPGDDNMKKEEDTVKTAALYIRVSTDKQEELSPDSQRRLLLDYAKSHNYDRVQPAHLHGKWYFRPEGG